MDIYEAGFLMRLELQEPGSVDRIHLVEAKHVAWKTYQEQKQEAFSEEIDNRKNIKLVNKMFHGGSYDR